LQGRDIGLTLEAPRTDGGDDVCTCNELALEKLSPLHSREKSFKKGGGRRMS